MINAEELRGRVYMLVQDFDPDIKGCQTWDDCIRHVIKIIDAMDVKPNLKEMSADEKRNYYATKQRESRRRRAMTEK